MTKLQKTKPLTVTVFQLSRDREFERKRILQKEVLIEYDRNKVFGICYLRSCATCTKDCIVSKEKKCISKAYTTRPIIYSDSVKSIVNYRSVVFKGIPVSWYIKGKEISPFI